MTAAIVNLTHHDIYVHWGFILISLSNFLVIIAMLVLFALALLVPFVHAKKKHHRDYTNNPDNGTAVTEDAVGGTGGGVGEATSGGVSEAVSAGGGGGVGEDAVGGTGGGVGGVGEATGDDVGEDGVDDGLWTATARRIWLKYLPPKKMLPDSQPAYVSSWVYVFGVLTLSALAVAILSGLVLAIKGPTWWHVSSIGHFDNSLHLWSVEMFMAFMAIHLWGKFWMAAWRGGRTATWITGVLAFVVSIVEAFTGYLSQTNFDSQWIAFESKDAFNAAGIGSLVNPMNFGQALMLHIALIPLVLVGIVGVHILMVRVRGVVHPIDALPEDRDPDLDPAISRQYASTDDHAGMMATSTESYSEARLEDAGER